MATSVSQTLCLVPKEDTIGALLAHSPITITTPTQPFTCNVGGIDIKGYTLNHDATARRFQECEERDAPLSIKSTQGGIVLTCNVKAYGLLKEEILKYFNNFRSFEFLSCKTTTACDQAGNIVSQTIKVFYPDGKTCYTVNCYHTKCRMLMNGKGIHRFVKYDWPKITAAAKEEAVALNQNMDDALTEYKGRKKLQQGPKAIASSENLPSVLHKSEKAVASSENLPSVLHKSVKENKIKCSTAAGDHEVVLNQQPGQSEPEKASTDQIQIHKFEKQLPEIENTSTKNNSVDQESSKNSEKEDEDTTKKLTVNEIHSPMFDNKTSDTSFENHEDQFSTPFCPTVETPRSFGKTPRPRSGKRSKGIPIKRNLDYSVTPRGSKMIRMLKQINEQMCSHSDQLAKLENRIEEHLTVTDRKIKELNNQINNLDKKLNTHNQQLRDEISSTSNNNKFELKRYKDEANNRLETIERKSDSYNKEKEVVEQKLKGAETRINNLEKRLEDLDKEMNNAAHGENQAVSIAPTFVQSYKAAVLNVAKMESNSINTSSGKSTNRQRIEDEHDRSDIIYVSEEYKFQKCRFKGFCAEIKSKEEVDKFVAQVNTKYPNTQEATHSMLSYVIKDDGNLVMDSHDDGEHGGGEVIMNTINRMNQSNVIVMVCRWYGEEHIYDARWKIIEDATQEVLNRVKYSFPRKSFTSGSNAPQGTSSNSNSQQPITSGPSNQVQGTLLLCDSTGGPIHMGRLLNGDIGNKESAPTFDTVKRKLIETAPVYRKIIIQSGINDLSRKSPSAVKTAINITLETCKEYHPKANVFVCSLLPYMNEENHEIEDVNHHIQSATMKFGYQFVNTSELFKGHPEYYRDRRHPNQKGVGVIVRSIKDKLGYPRPTLLQRQVSQLGVQAQRKGPLLPTPSYPPNWSHSASYRSDGYGKNNASLPYTYGYMAAPVNRFSY